MTDEQAVKNAIFRDSKNPVMISVSLTSSWYQRNDQPPHLVTMGLPLKLKIMSVKMGMYRNRNTTP